MSRREIGATGSGSPRRVRLSPDERKELLLEQALAVFIERGYSGTTLEMIAGRAGVAKALPLFHFGSKAEIFRAVVRKSVQDYMPELSSVAADDRLPWDKRFSSALEIVYDHIAKSASEPPIFFLISSEGRRFPELVDIFFQDAIRPASEALQKLLDLGRAEGVVRNAPMEHATEVIFSGPLLAAIWRLVFDDRHPIDLASFRNTHIDMILNGLRTR